jgi:transcriptional regulator with XRE-family HTH domain
VANRIRELRLERARQFPSAFTIAEVAQRIGIAERTLRYWETGETQPTKRHAQRLAKEFGVTVADLGLDQAETIEDVRARRRAARLEWARQSEAAPPPAPGPPGADRPGGRPARP